MITCAVNVAENRWREWLDAVGNMTVVRDVEFPASLLINESNAMALAERYGLKVSHAQDLLPPEVARYLTESPLRGRDDVLPCLGNTLKQCRAGGVRSVSLEMGLDRIGEATLEQDLAERIKLLRSLMPVADSQRLTLCIQVRYPRAFPGSREWEYAGNLVHEVMNPCCRLAVNLVPSDFPQDFELRNFIRSCYFNIGIVRFHYDPALGENLTMDTQAEWAAVLQNHGFKGGVVFCPRVSGPDGIATACSQIDQWAALYSS